MSKKHRIGPYTKVRDLASNPVLNELTHAGIVVWLRVVAASATRGKLFTMTNKELHEVPRTAQRALVELQQRELIKVHVNEVDNSRCIEVL